MCWCWANLQNTHFCGLTRKNWFFKRSVLKYVSIKKTILTQSGRKRRVCVNQPDGSGHASGNGGVSKGKPRGEKERKDVAGKDKAPCAMSSKGLWSNR